jgi:hypothetical protein
MFLWGAELYNPSDTTNPPQIDWVEESPSTDCVYGMDYASFGLPTNEILNSPEISLGLDNLYISFQAWTPGFASYTGTYIARFDLDDLASCGTTPYTYFYSASMYGFAMAGGGHGMYFGSNTYLSSAGCTVSTCANGTQMRIFQWTEGASSITYSDHTIAAFPYLYGGTGNCASQDGRVTNWCGNVDSLISSAYYSRAAYRGYGPGVLGFAWTQGPMTGDTFPSVYRVYFALPSLAYQSSDLVYNGDYAVVAPAFAVNVFGFVGGIMSIGGGTGTGTSAIDTYPGYLTLLEDTDSPTQPWTTTYNAGSRNSPSADWSVSNSIRADLPADQVFIAASSVTSTVAASGVVPVITIFGRERYSLSYTYWA